MKREKAKEILMLFRPGTSDAEDPKIIEAMEVVRADSALAQWFEQHVAFQKALRLKFREIEVPEHLKVALLARQTIVRPPVWHRPPVWWTAAAALLVVVGLAVVLLKPDPPDRFANFRERMVSTALREYRMDIVTNDMGSLRRFVQARGAPADYELHPGLQKLQVTGGAALTWRNHPVSMVCFDRGNRSMVFLFVMRKSAVKDPPPHLSPPSELPNVAPVSDMLTASWTEGDNSYLLLDSAEPDFPRKYLY